MVLLLKDSLLLTMKQYINAKTIVRFVLSLALIFGVYVETGFWTALSLFLIFIYIELSLQRKKISITLGTNETNIH